MHEASFYQPAADGAVHCGLCRFRCHIPSGGRGVCGVRENRGGVLYTLVYGMSVAEQVDPVEKKPLFHLLPATTTFSVATVGCNFRCLHCQNAAISQVAGAGTEIRGRSRTPAQLVAAAGAAGCASLSYTYTEPTVFYEFARDTAELAAAAGLKNIFVTNGYITAEALAGIAPLLHGANIDLKGFSDRFYREVVRASRREVLDAIIEYRRHGIWIELTTLLIPGWNDEPDELQQMAAFVAGHLGCEVPWHLTAFHPSYRLTDVPPAPPALLLRAREIALSAGLHHVYTGNAAIPGGEDTRCPSCRALLVRRAGFTVVTDRLDGGACPDCGTAIAGIWQ